MINMILGSIIGDISGSYYEQRPIKTKDYPFIKWDSHITDDSVLTIAVMNALMLPGNLEESCAASFKIFGNAYPYAGYGPMFANWLMSDDLSPYNSFGNGAAMRISPVSYIADNIEDCKRISRIVTQATHINEDAYKAAEAVSVAGYLAIDEASKEEIEKQMLNYYDLDFSIDDIRDSYEFDMSCTGSVPQSIKCFLESESYEDAVRTAVSLGGDSDTMAAIAGGIASAFYKEIPDDIFNKAVLHIPSELIEIILTFEDYVKNKKGE